MLDHSNSIGVTKGIVLEDGSSMLSLLQFTDDTLIFLQNNEIFLDFLINILICFEMISGLKINFNKSSLIGINFSDLSVRRMAEKFGCGIGKLPCKYLGLPLSHKSLSNNIWLPVVDNIKKRINSWQGGLIFQVFKAVLDFGQEF